MYNQGDQSDSDDEDEEVERFSMSIMPEMGEILKQKSVRLGSGARDAKTFSNDSNDSNEGTTDRPAEAEQPNSNDKPRSIAASVFKTEMEM